MTVTPDPYEPRMPMPFARVARQAITPSATDTADWITEYLAFHTAVEPSAEDRPWNEAFASSGQARVQEIADLRLRLHHLQQRVQALEQR